MSDFVMRVIRQFSSAWPVRLLLAAAVVTMLTAGSVIWALLGGDPWPSYTRELRSLRNRFWAVRQRRRLRT